jgi:hypothetical protein
VLPKDILFFHQVTKKAWEVLVYIPFPYIEVKTTLEEEITFVLELGM